LFKEKEIETLGGELHFVKCDLTNLHELENIIQNLF